MKLTEDKQNTILIVDDVFRNLQVLGNILREKNYRISVASSGSKALEIVEQRLPDIILLDVMMPEPDGFQVCSILKTSEKTKHIPIIFLTARTDSVDIVKGFELGGVDYITKPFNKFELLARINTHLELRNAQKEIVRLAQRNAILAMSVTANHEINQPLTVLQGNFELFLAGKNMDLLTEKQRHYLSKIEKSIENIRIIMKKFSCSSPDHFENYLDSQEMIIFNEMNENTSPKSDILKIQGNLGTESGPGNG